MTDLNKLIKKYRGMGTAYGPWLMPPLVCRDGFSVSVQASASHYCQPRDDEGPYTHVEMGFPSAPSDLLTEYAEDAEDAEDDPTCTVYVCVPLSVVEALLESHGGFEGLQYYDSVTGAVTLEIPAAQMVFESFGE
jgi:hypothetical protein